MHLQPTGYSEPSYTAFDEPRRKATADAGEMAGLKRAGHRQRADRRRAGLRRDGWATWRPPATPQEEMTVLVYDLGGGTFDVTLLRLAPGDIRTLATDGDVQLGGHDWDLRLVDHVAESFKAAARRRSPRGPGRA